MSTLVERLRKAAQDEVAEMRESWEFTAPPPTVDVWLEWKAANEIESLEQLVRDLWGGITGFPPDHLDAEVWLESHPEHRETIASIVEQKE